MKAELSQQQWMEWTAHFLPPSLARVLFESKLDKPLKTVWRFVDFAEFCMIYGMSNSLEAMASALCVAFQHNIMNIQKTNQQQPQQDQPLKVTIPSEGDEDAISTANMKLLVYLLSLPSASCDTMQAETSLEAASRDGGGLARALETYCHYVNPVVDRDLAAIEDVWRCGPAGPSLQPYVHAICQNYAVLPGLKLLAMTACCLFGLRPIVPFQENEYITELMLWDQAVRICDRDV
jgi:hypothetical protein